MRVYVTLQVRRPGITVRRLRQVVGYVLRRQRCGTATEVALALVSDAVIRGFHRRFLGIDRVTDVLSFPLDNRRGPHRRGPGRAGSPQIRPANLGGGRPEARSPTGTRTRGRHMGQYLGDVVISVDRARVQARAVGHPVRTEIALLAVHGVLHLLGYDDRRRDDAAKMARRQRILTAAAGFEVAG